MLPHLNPTTSLPLKNNGAIDGNRDDVEVERLAALPVHLGLSLCTRVVAHSCLTPAPGDPVLSSGLVRHQTGMWYTDTHTNIRITRCPWSDLPGPQHACAAQTYK